MKKSLFKKISLSVVLFAQSFWMQGCGTGVDPLILFDDSLPTLGPITSGSIAGSFLTQVYTEANPYWIFNNASFAGNFLAPANGVVTEITTNSISILHSARILSKIEGFSSINVRLGDTVYAEQALAFFIGGTPVKFQVFLDGNAICPLSFLSQSFRASMINFNAGAGPCQ